MRPLAAWLALLLLISPALASTRSAALDRYHALLAKNCGAKHLDLLTPRALRSFELNFADRIPHGKRIKLAGVANSDTLCTAKDIACGNVGFIRAAAETGLLLQFADMMCRLPVACQPGKACNP